MERGEGVIDGRLGVIDGTSHSLLRSLALPAPLQRMLKVFVSVLVLAVTAESANELNLNATAVHFNATIHETTVPALIVLAVTPENATEHTTELTEPKTEPATENATEHATEQPKTATENATEHATEPKTEPATENSEAPQKAVYCNSVKKQKCKVFHIVSNIEQFYVETTGWHTVLCRSSRLHKRSFFFFVVLRNHRPTTRWIFCLDFPVQFKVILFFRAGSLRLPDTR
jgi:hypothetical protein